MRQVTKVFNIVKFPELSQEVQEKVQERWAKRERFNWDHHERCAESFTIFLKLLGFERIKVLCSQSWCCQGDGSSFKADWYPHNIDVAKLKEEFPECEDYHKFADQLALWHSEHKEVWKVEISQNGRYCHSGEMSIENFFDENGDWLDMDIDEEKNLLQIFREIANDYHKDCGIDYDYCTGEECFKETDEYLTQEYYENGREYEGE